GGSVAWVDTGGALRVGPQSAGAVPGPACYGRGGRQPTVTDADLVLGYLPAGRLAGGISLDADRARAAVEEGVAGPLGIGAAHGPRWVPCATPSRRAAGPSWAPRTPTAAARSPCWPSTPATPARPISSRCRSAGPGTWRTFPVGSGPCTARPMGSAWTRPSSW